MANNTNVKVITAVTSNGSPVTFVDYILNFQEN